MPSLRRSILFYFFGLTFFFAHLGLSPSSHGQSITPFSNGSIQQTGQYRDTLRALIVFTQFKNDKYPGDPAVNYREWPLSANPNDLPSFANALLSRSASPPYPDSSLTAYFYNQSLGQFILYGEAYDSVLVTSKDESKYHKPNGGYGDLTQELLDKIDSYGFDFSKFDHNRDGYIDYVFVVLRGDSKRDSKVFAWTGASCLDGRCTGSVLLDGGPKKNPVYDGKMLDWNKSGSYIMHRTPGNVSPFHYYIRLMAHEIGHDLWSNYFIHIPDNRTNDVPFKHNRGRFRDCLGYVLMAGAGGAWDCGGSETISAYERELLGWITCTNLSSSATNTRIGDLYTTSSCYTIDLSPPDRRLYVSNLQHISYFDQQRTAGNQEQFQIGLRTNGALIHLANKRGVDVVPADNDLALSSTHAIYEGDLFDPKSSIQITPWTRPNSNGYTVYPNNVQPDWIALDNFRYDSDSSGALIFDFYSDFRTAPIIREDSWIGAETKDYQFDAPIEVVNRSTLVVGTDISVTKKLLISPGSTVHISLGAVLALGSQSVLDLRQGSTLIVEGTLVSNGLISRSPRAKLIVRENGRIQSTLGED
ncbi:MAG: hypothetical protein KTR29_22400 [Rhodothermaceae bacterium]|nr:hypothetical protein [Rhodothermaceae bacterium]